MMCCGCTWGEREFVWGEDQKAPVRQRSGGGSYWALAFAAFACCIILASAAPAALHTEDFAMDEEKRSEEVSFGNQQNMGIHKKSANEELENEATDLENDAEDSNAEDSKESDTEKDNTAKEESEEISKHNDDDDDDGYKVVNHKEDNPVKRSVPHMSETKIKRSAPLMSESHMLDSPKRSKRDLSYEELRKIFSDQPDNAYDYNDKISQLAGIPEADYSDYSDGAQAPYYDLLGNLDGEGAGFLEAPPSKEEAIEKEVVRYEVLKELLEKKEEEEEKEEVLDWLIAAANDRLEEAVKEEKEAEIEEKLAEEAWLQNQLAGEAESSVDKRYPYSYEPYGGRWGAMVPGSKRGQPEWVNYGRLYELAKALNDNERLSEDK